MMTPERDAVTRARARVWDVYNGDDRCRSGRDMPEALDAYEAAVCQQALAEVVAVVKGKRMSMELSGPHEDADVRATFTFDAEGGWVRWPEFLTAIRALTEAK